jgi:hypothetical protein
VPRHGGRAAGGGKKERELEERTTWDSWRSKGASGGTVGPGAGEWRVDAGGATERADPRGSGRKSDERLVLSSNFLGVEMHISVHLGI